MQYPATLATFFQRRPLTSCTGGSNSVLFGQAKNHIAENKAIRFGMNLERFQSLLTLQLRLFATDLLPVIVVIFFWSPFPHG